MRINNNLMAMNTHRQLGLANTAGAKSMEKLSSGFRINRAGDDAAGLSISEKMRGQIRGLNQASRNAQDSISLIQTAEGALTESHAILQRMRELAVQSANDTNVEVDRGALQSEIDQLSQELTRIAETTEFNTQKLLDGKFEDRVFHIGANEAQNIKLSIADMGAKALKVEGEAYTDKVGDDLEVTSRDNTLQVEIKKAAASGGTGATAAMSSGKVTVTVEFSGTKIKATSADVKAALEGLGLTVAYASGKDGAADAKAVGPVTIKTVNSGASKNFGVDISTQAKADTAITTINNALETVSAERSKLGAYQNRLEHTIKNLDNVSENLLASESRIRDVDMAKEMMEMTKQNILQQASTAMLAQANSNPQTVLQLLR